MKSTLYIKFIIIYIIFAFLSVFTVSTLTAQLFLQKEEARVSSMLFEEASLISTDYLPSYFSESIDKSTVHSQLQSMRIYMNCSIWFTDTKGTLITSADMEQSTSPKVIQDFDPAETARSNYIIGHYHGYFKNSVMTVVSPVTQGFSTKGYILLHYPMAQISHDVSRSMRIVYLTLAAIYILSFIFLVGFHFFVFRPLGMIASAAKQYAVGNLDYDIPINSHDEIGYLSASLNYMSSQIRDMEDYQKKFIANVSHDFRSPLTSIKGYLEAMQDGTIPPEQYGKYINIILFETERLTDLTNDLLTLNEFDTKELLLNRTDFDIQDMIKKTAASFEGTCRSRDITISLLFLPEKAMVYADERKIQQVLYNLVDNAIKFSPRESSVAIEVSLKGDAYSISVKDYGIGIPRKDVGKIWERFYKSDLSRGKDKKGTGLGLSIVKEIIQAHDEHINVISTEGVGTEFIFSLSRSSKKH